MAAWTLASWLIAGAVVGALLARREPGGALARAARAPVHVLLWPLFVPLLLPRPAQASPAAAASVWDEPIARAEAALGEALEGLSRQLEDPLALERARVTTLVRAMRNAAARLGELDRVVSAPEFDAERLRQELDERRNSQDAHAVVEVLERRLQHVERLGQIRRQARADLERALQEAAALASRLTLLRYEGPPGAASAASCARALTECVEELSRVLVEARAA